MQKILIRRVYVLIDLEFKTMSPTDKRKYLISPWIYSFIFDPAKLFFFCEMSTKLDKLLRSSEFCKLAFSSKKYFDQKKKNN